MKLTEFECSYFVEEPWLSYVSRDETSTDYILVMCNKSPFAMFTANICHSCWLTSNS